MTNDVPWTKSLGFRLGAIAFSLLAIMVLLFVSSYYALRSMQGDAASLALFAKGRMYSYQILFLANRITNPDDENPQQARADLLKIVSQMDERSISLEKGNDVQNVPKMTNRDILAGILARRKIWEESIKPTLLALSATPSDQEAKVVLAKGKLGVAIDDWQADLEKGVQNYQNMLNDKIPFFLRLLYIFAAAVLLVIGFLLWIGRTIVARTRTLVRMASRIAAGELALSTTVHGSDEIAALGEAFNTMTASLKRTIEDLSKQEAGRSKLFESIRVAVAQLSSTSTELLATTTQQARGTQEQAAAVSQTVATVDELTQTAEQASKRANAVAEAVRRTDEVGVNGRKAVEGSIAAMEEVKDQVESIAENILTLAERAQAIGEIIATANDIAEQTNLLALNAAVEASRAGEHGKGFAVVAGEVKALAEQSKKATSQVRQILGQIQQATNSAVLATEQGTKAVAAASGVVGQAGQTIVTLSETLADSARSATQISASAGQQAAGVIQLKQAIKSIDDVARQNLTSIREIEQASRDLNELSSRLAGLTNV